MKRSGLLIVLMVTLALAFIPAHTARAQGLCTGRCYEAVSCPYCTYTLFLAGHICIETNDQYGCYCYEFACDSSTTPAASNSTASGSSALPSTEFAIVPPSNARLRVIAAQVLPPRC